VNAVSPGPIETNFINRADMDEKREEQFREQVESQVPLGRFGEAEEVANVALFLLSDAAANITGEVMVTDGGYSL
jgi:NAD(P)-dependent dehydrogenase (short-subunit alcohol dehydrogenase family)